MLRVSRFVLVISCLLRDEAKLTPIHAAHTHTRARFFPIETAAVCNSQQGNNIGNLAGLNRCRTLVEVNLDGNKIRQLGPPSAFHGLGNLRKLRLEDNGLRVLSPGLGASTPALLSLSLAQNRLSDPAELDRLGALPNLMELSVCGNPMAR